MANISPFYSRICSIFLLVIVASGQIGLALSLLLGVVYALLIGNCYPKATQKAAGLLLKTSIILLGLTIELSHVVTTAKEGFVITFASIVFSLGLGVLLGRLFKVEKATATLIACGSAICGASAIAAIAPAIKARRTDIMVSLAVVFLLNAIGLLIFPEIGRWLSLTERQFGYWAALAIHDTSSVLGAASHYGDIALQVATSAKLARALWIIPLAIALSAYANKGQGRVAIPWFILLFVAASLINSLVALPAQVNDFLPSLVKTGMAISLFLLGSGFSRESLAEVKLSALWQGLLLWLSICGFSLWLIKLL